MTPPPSPEQLENACWGSPLKALQGKITGLTDPRVTSLILCGVLAVLYAILH